jgi:hypothetical protein
MYKQYQLISIDAYRPPYIPPIHNSGFFQEVYDHLSKMGVLVIMFPASGKNRRLAVPGDTSASFSFGLCLRCTGYF